MAQEQRQWEQAEQSYQQALQISIESNDRYSQASTYHQLGSVAEEQRQWDKAREYFLRALETYVPTRMAIAAALWYAVWPGWGRLVAMQACPQFLLLSWV